MLDYSRIEIPDDTSFDGANPSMWGVADPFGQSAIFICLFCYREIEATFPRYHKILDKSYSADDVTDAGWRSPCCIHKIERIN